MECQRLFPIHHGKSGGSEGTLTYLRTIGRLCSQKCFLRHRHYALKEASTEHQRFEAFYFGKSMAHVTTMINNCTIGRLSMPICLREDHNHVPKWTSTERQWFVHWHLAKSNRNEVEINHTDPYGSLSGQTCYWRYRVCLQHFSAHSVSRLRTLHNNYLLHAVPKWSFMRSVIAICPCFELHKSACNVLLIWLFSLYQ
jgi:hypothetical protein